MQLMKTVKVPVCTKRVLDKTICDFCGKIIVLDSTTVAKVKLSCNKGISFPEYGTGVETIFDCCVTCWDSIIIPKFQELGIKPRIIKWDY